MLSTDLLRSSTIRTSALLSGGAEAVQTSLEVDGFLRGELEFTTGYGVEYEVLVRDFAFNIDHMGLFFRI